MRNAAPPTATDTAAQANSPKLLVQVLDKLRVLHYSKRTEKSYLLWIEQFLRFARQTHHNRCIRRSFAAAKSVPFSRTSPSNATSRPARRIRHSARSCFCIDASWRSRCRSRHPHRAGAARPRRRLDDDDLHARAAARCLRCHQPARSVVKRSPLSPPRPRRKQCAACHKSTRIVPRLPSPRSKIRSLRHHNPQSVDATALIRTIG